MTLRPATREEAVAIVALLKANAGDRSIALRPRRDVQRHLEDFLVCPAQDGGLGACAAFHLHAPDLGELLSVAVHPRLHGRGLGTALVRACLERAAQRAVQRVFLVTAKPAWFERFGFRRVSQWRFPLAVLLTKARQGCAQPPSRLPGALLTPYVFMERGEA